MTISKALQIFISKGGKIKKFTAQSKPKPTQFTDEARLLRQHRAEKLARGTEYKAIDVGLKRIRAQSLKLFGANRIQTKKAKGIIQRGEIRAIKIARKKGVQTLETKSTKLKVPIRRFGSQKTKARIGVSESEAKTLGFAPREMSAEMKSFYAKGTPSALVKKHRKTLSKIYAKPKSWKQRSKLKSHYRAAAKSELKQAKIDRAIWRDTTIQKQSKSGKWKTVWTQPKPEYKKWK